MLWHLFSTDPDWTLTATRVVLGVVFFAHGAQKMLGWFGGAGLKKTLRTMHESLRLPVPLAFLAVIAEFLGGAGLIVGLLSRVAAIGVCATMLSAIVMVHWSNGLFMNWFGDRKGARHRVSPAGHCPGGRNCSAGLRRGVAGSPFYISQ